MFPFYDGKGEINVFQGKTHRPLTIGGAVDTGKGVDTAGANGHEVNRDV